MDKYLDVPQIDQITHVKHLCDCGYYTRDRSNYNKHVRRCKLHLTKQSSGPRKSKTAKKKSPKKTTEKAYTLENPQSADQSGRQRFICDKCGNKYLSKYGLELHIKSKHEGIFKHQCSMCNKKFNETSQYRYHCMKHLEIPIEKCEHCRSTFSSPGSLKRHLKSCNYSTETYEKFTCDQCNASFSLKDRLHDHQRGKHQPHKYSCQGCNRTFAWRSSLKTHKRRCKIQIVKEMLE